MGYAVAGGGQNAWAGSTTRQTQALLPFEHRCFKDASSRPIAVLQDSAPSRMAVMVLGALTAAPRLREPPQRLALWLKSDIGQTDSLRVSGLKSDEIGFGMAEFCQLVT